MPPDWTAKSRKEDRWFNRFFAAVVVIALAFTAGLVFVAIHFLMKIW